jgi:hypothetical protein
MNNTITVRRTLLIYIIVAVLLFCLLTSNTSIAEAKKKHQQKSDDTKANAAEPASNQNDCAAPCGTPFPPGETATTTLDNNPATPTPSTPPTTIPPFIIGDDRGGGHHSSQSGSKGKNLVNIPSKQTDFPDNNVNVIQVYVTSAKKDIIGAYHVRGEITNNGSDPLQFVKVTAHLYDGSGQPVAVTTCCYADPHDIEPGHTSTFDSFAQEDVISGTPTSYRLSFDWR